MGRQKENVSKCHGRVRCAAGVAFQAPWGFSPAFLPEIPLPTKIRTAFQPPVELDTDPERADDQQYVEQIYSEVCASIQHGMDTLARRRRLPLFG